MLGTLAAFTISYSAHHPAVDAILRIALTTRVAERACRGIGESPAAAQSLRITNLWPKNS